MGGGAVVEDQRGAIRHQLRRAHADGALAFGVDRGPGLGVRLGPLGRERAAVREDQQAARRQRVEVAPDGLARDIQLAHQFANGQRAAGGELVEDEFLPLFSQHVDSAA